MISLPSQILHPGSTFFCLAVFGGWQCTKFLQVSFLGAVRRAAVCELEEEQDEHNGQAGQHHHGQEPGQGGQGGRQGDECVQGPKSLFFPLTSISVSFESTSPSEAETL